VNHIITKQARLRLEEESYRELRKQVLRRAMAGAANYAAQ